MGATLVPDIYRLICGYILDARDACSLRTTSKGMLTLVHESITKIIVETKRIKSQFLVALVNLRSLVCYGVVPPPYLPRALSEIVVVDVDFFDLSPLLKMTNFMTTFKEFLLTNKHLWYEVSVTFCQINTDTILYSFREGTLYYYPCGGINIGEIKALANRINKFLLRRGVKIEGGIILMIPLCSQLRLDQDFTIKITEMIERYHVMFDCQPKWYPYAPPLSGREIKILFGALQAIRGVNKDMFINIDKYQEWFR